MSLLIRVSFVVVVQRLFPLMAGHIYNGRAIDVVCSQFLHECFFGGVICQPLGTAWRWCVGYHRLHYFVDGVDTKILPFEPDVVGWGWGCCCQWRQIKCPARS